MHGECLSRRVLCDTFALNFPKPNIYDLNNDYVVELNRFTESANTVRETTFAFADGETVVTLNGAGVPLPNADNNIEAKANTGESSITLGSTPLAPTVSKKKRKSTVKVSILNVEAVSPIPEGVNTPLSVAICRKHGFNPIELIPRNLCSFVEPAVPAELADVRYQCYEKRRQARMVAVLPERLELEKLAQNPMENTHVNPRDGKALKRAVAAADSVLRQKCRSISSSWNSVGKLNVSVQHQNLKQQNDHMENDLSIFLDNLPSASNVNNPLNSIRLSSVKRHSSICSSVEHPVGAPKTQNLLLAQRQSSHPSDRNTFQGSTAYNTQSHNASAEIEQELQVLDKVIQQEKRAARTVQKQRESMEKKVELHFLKNQEKLMNAQQNYKMTRLRSQQETLNKIKMKESHIHTAEPVGHGAF